MTRSSTRPRARACLAALMLCGAPLAAAAAVPAPTTTPDCAGLAGFTAPGVTLEPAQSDPATGLCTVNGRMAERQGQDGKPYALRFQLQLPAGWNRDYIHQFNGGVDGVVVPATGQINVGNPGDTAVSRGFAVVSSDSGHAIDAQPEAGIAGATRFGFDAEARADYGYSAVEKLDPVARAIVAAAYHQPIAHAYGVGRSNGGRHALVTAARMPGAFDGFLVGYPGFDLPHAAIQHAWDAQAFHALDPDIRKALSREDMDRLARGILARCDALDGLADGQVQAWSACQQAFRIEDLACAPASGPDCLGPEKAAALARIAGGPHDSQGRALYSAWLFDPGMASGNWRQWKLEGTNPKTDMMPNIVAMGAGSLAQVFSTPPKALGPGTADMIAYLLAYDFDRDPAAITATSADFPQSADTVMRPPGMEGDGFEAFRKAGGKMVIFHGLADPVFSTRDTIDWFAKLPHAAGFARLYLVPGMPHGHDGAATDDADFLSALTNWVEHGVAPGAITASNHPDAGSPIASVSRPLCPFPEAAFYVGGDPASAASFACRAQ